MQIALGAVYAWSVFRIPLTKQYGYTDFPGHLVFEIAILTLGFAAFLRRPLDERKAGPRALVGIVAVSATDWAPCSPGNSPRISWLFCLA